MSNLQTLRSQAYLESLLKSTAKQLNIFAKSDNFWHLFDTAFGTGFDREIAEKLQSQWQGDDLNHLPEIEIVSSDILGNATSAYAISTNKIYLSDTFLATAATATLTSVLLEEIGHFIDAKINRIDRSGDEGQLFSALVQAKNLTDWDFASINAENDAAIITISDQKIAVEQSALNFNITFDDPTGAYASSYNIIKSNVAAAGTNWNKYIQANGSLEVIVRFSNSGPTATGRSLSTFFLGKSGSLDLYEQGAASELRTGIDPNGTSPDIEISFNPDYFKDELWFDPNPSAQTTLIPANRTDAISVLTHEFGHALAFNGWADEFDGTLPDYQSTFDEQTIFDGTNFYFAGPIATAVYGSAVPLTFGNISHLGNYSPRPGSDLIPDLMNGVVFDRGTRYTISALDLAILADTAVPIGYTVPKIPTVSLADVQREPGKYMAAIRDYDGKDLGSSSSWKFSGTTDIQGDGDIETILVNPAIGRFASVGSVGGNVDFTKYGLNGDTRVVGIYIDPTLKSKPQNIGGPFDSQRRFQNDLKIDNLKLIGAFDYDKDGFQDLYFRLGDGSAVLRALMFKDGNIQYANYQSKTDLAAFMNDNNVNSLIWGNWL